MSMRMLRRYFSKVAVIAGTPKSDKIGAQVIDIVKQVKPDVELIGIGGTEMASTGLKWSVNCESLPERPFFPITHFLVDPRFYLSPYMMVENLRSLRLFYRLYKDRFQKHFGKESKQEIDMAVTVDNQLFAFRFFELMDHFYRDGTSLKPLRVHFGDTIRNYNYSHLRSVDCLLYTLPLKSKDKQLFAFPSQFVGKQPVFDALKYVLKSSVQYGGAQGEDSIKVPKDHFYELIRQFRLSIREVYRRHLKWSNNALVIYFDPGTNSKSISENLALLSAVLPNAALKTGGSENVKILINVQNHSKQDEQTIEKMTEKGFQVHLIEGRESTERYEAMAAADLAAIDNGDALFEAATLQLATVVLDTVGRYRGYIGLMHNLYESELNLAMEGLLFPELTLQNFPNKLWEYWENWIDKPHLKADIANRFKSVLPSLLPNDSQLNFNSGPRDELLRGQLRLYSPEYVAKGYLKKVYSEFLLLKQSKLSLGEKELKRKELVLGPE